MKNLVSSVVLFFIICPFFVSNTFACMPHSPILVTIATYNGVIEWVHPDSSKVQFLSLSNLKKPFWEENNAWSQYFLHADEPQVHERLNMSKYHPGDQIIMIADVNNGSYNDYFAVYEVGKLISSQSGTLQITNKIWTIKDWGTKMFECGHYKKEENIQTEQEFAWEIASYLKIQDTPKYSYSQILSDVKRKMKEYLTIFLELLTMRT